MVDNKEDVDKKEEEEDWVKRGMKAANLLRLDQVRVLPFVFTPGWLIINWCYNGPGGGEKEENTRQPIIE